MSERSTCPECGGGDLYRHRFVSSGGGHGPHLLPGLGEFLAFATFTVVVCSACGLTRFYADREARARLPRREDWKRVV